ncbi:hypothetical protein [Zooshikella harenae]|uniref:Uncharacterized protein n=1 Tax=Zooshikella harenae TaxID=2827238 RepID=A0ABS5ZHB7_9GAMM|nr:hypothetical protein [Zooshikella harenae]MBU2712650.1 hypothetical protein [Zooshikella harenae]
MVGIALTNGYFYQLTKEMGDSSTIEAVGGTMSSACMSTVPYAPIPRHIQRVMTSLMKAALQAIHGQKTPVLVVKQFERKNSYLDEGIEMREVETTYYFDNGVIIKNTIEQDDIPSENRCPECWISYSVIDTAGINIQPLNKLFHNHSQEQFWLKMHSNKLI